VSILISSRHRGYSRAIQIKIEKRKIKNIGYQKQTKFKNQGYINQYRI
jgi:hypothetical protein